MLPFPFPSGFRFLETCFPCFMPQSQPCHLSLAHLVGVWVGSFWSWWGWTLSISSWLLSNSADAVCVLQLLLQG